MKQKTLFFVVLFMMLYFFVKDMSVINQIEILVVLNVKGFEQKNISN